MIKIMKPFVVITTRNTSLVFEIKPYLDKANPSKKKLSFVSVFHYGKKINLKNLKPSDNTIGTRGSNENYILDNLLTSSVGNGNNNEVSIIIDSKEESYTNRFFFKNAKIIKGEVKVDGPHARKVDETLEIIEEDDVSCLELHHYFSVFDDSDVIAIKRKLVNKRKDSIKIKRLYSLELPLKSHQLVINTYDGSWLCERMRHQVILESGVFTNASFVGSSSHKHNPYIELIDKTKNKFYAFNFIYSGNHKETVEVDRFYTSKIMVGINDFCFDYEVKSNDSFTTPEAVMLVTDNQDEATHKMHEFTLNHIIDPKFNKKVRPIIFNNWEGTGMKIDEKSLLEMASIAKRVGIEQFVMDDGWFKNRVDDHHALGDWIVDKKKFPNGLKSLANNIRKLGLKFGIWVEPEMISFDSDLYRRHPEYASIIPGRTPLERRHQLMLDMSNKNVQDILYKMLCKVFDEVKPDYVKWDYNRYMSDNYSHFGTKKGEFMHRFIMGTYNLMDKLVNRYPNILFESCSSGGGRYDLGMLYYMPQTWGSDDTNSYFRTFIACGTLTMYPQSSYGAHVSKDGLPFENIGGTSSLEDRFNIHSIGAFGYEFDIRKLSQKELDIIKKQIEYYKKHRELLQFGSYYSIDNCFDNHDYFSYIVTSKKLDEAMLVIVETKPNAKKKIWKAKHLNPKFIYQVSMRPQYNINKTQLLNKKISGRELMNKGLDIGSLYSTTDKKEYKGIYSRMIYLKKVNK